MIWGENPLFKETPSCEPGLVNYPGNGWSWWSGSASEALNHSQQVVSLMMIHQGNPRKSFMFRGKKKPCFGVVLGYNPCFFLGGFKPSCFHGLLGVQGQFVYQKCRRQILRQIEFDLIMGDWQRPQQFEILYNCGQTSIHQPPGPEQPFFMVDVFIFPILPNDLVFLSWLHKWPFRIG